MRNQFLSAMPKPAPCCIWTADVRMYNIDDGSPWWKRALFKIYCAMVEFCFERFHFVPWDHRDSQGNYSFLLRVGAFTERWQAAQEAAKHPHGFSLKLPLNEPLGVSSVPVESIPSRSAATKAYERINRRTIEVPLEAARRLQRKLEETRVTTA